MRKWVQLVLFIIGVILCTFGAVTTIFWPTIFEMLVNTQLQLTRSSRSFEIWRDTPVPMSMKIYLFNWTNPNKLMTKEKPDFVEMGPYTFDEYHEKVNISFHDNHTVTFQQIRKWRFDPERSNGSLSDMVTTLNVPPLTAAYVTRFWGFFVQTSLSYVLGRFETMSVTKNVSELLFEGYNDPLISLADTLPALAGVNIPFDKFGWFYTRNGSDTYDGVFNMDTGSDEINKLGTLRKWNYRSRTDYYEGHCGEITGSAGELWPPHRQKDNISMFSSDLCRSIELPYESEMETVGIPAYRYVADATLVDNGTLDERNLCFCGGECLPIGVANASSCRYGSPAFVSYPHFLHADPYYSSLITGMKPDPNKHTFHITLEPNTGIPLDVAARLQINILLQPYKHIGMYQKVPTVLFPMLWFEETASMTPEMASSLSMLLELRTWGVIPCIVLIVTGLLLIVAVGVNFVISRCRPKNKSSEKKGEAVSHSTTFGSELSRPLMLLNTVGSPPRVVSNGHPSESARAPFAEMDNMEDDCYTDLGNEIHVSNGDATRSNGVYPQLTTTRVS